MSAEIRVFVSGTFADFQALNRVWPTIRARARARRRLVDIDLRWGVPANSSPRQTLLVCLSEVRRADVVVCLLGARYGWVPDAADAAAAWAELGEEGVPSPGASITELELAMAKKHGVPIVAFERDDKLVSGSRPMRAALGGAASKWAETAGSEAARRMASLRAALRDTGASAAYAAAFDGVDASGGVRLRFDELAAQAVGRVWAAIEAVLPADADDGAGAAHSAEAARAALVGACPRLFGRRAELDVLVDSAAADDDGSARLGSSRLEESGRDDGEAEAEARARLAVVWGDSGVGKSALLAALSARLADERGGRVHVLPVLCGGASGITTAGAACERISELVGGRAVDADLAPSLLPACLAEAAAGLPEGESIVVIVDGADEAGV